MGVAGVEVGSGAGVAVVSMVALVAGFAGLAFGFSAPIKINTPGYLFYFSMSWMENKVWLSGGELQVFELKIF